MARKYQAEYGNAAYWKEWHEVRKLLVMRVALRAKFDQHPDLAERLIATGDKHLVEDSPSDAYW